MCPENLLQLREQIRLREPTRKDRSADGRRRTALPLLEQFNRRHTFMRTPAMSTATPEYVQTIVKRTPTVVRQRNRCGGGERVATTLSLRWHHRRLSHKRQRVACGAAPRGRRKLDHPRRTPMAWEGLQTKGARSAISREALPAADGKINIDVP